MKKGQIELGVEYKLRQTNTDMGRVRFVSLTPPASPADYPVYDYMNETVGPSTYRLKVGELPAEQWIAGQWQPVLVRPADVACRWDDPGQVASRERLADRRAKADQAVQILRALGFVTDDSGDARFYARRDPKPQARVTKLSSAPGMEPLVEIDLDAFLARLLQGGA